MQKFVAFSLLICAVLAAPSASSRRCSNYKLPAIWKPLDHWNDQEYYVVASTGTGSIYAWETDYQRCNGYFLYGTECCGSCTTVRFTRIPRYTQYDAFVMVLYSYNACSAKYDISENFLGPAYTDNVPIYRSYYRDSFDAQYFQYSDAVDPDFVPYDAYAKDISYSIAVLDYYSSGNIIVLVVCNHFSYLTYGDAPTIFVLSKKERLTADGKRWVRGVLDNNAIDKRGVYFRDNYNCKARDVYTPSIYW